MTRQAMSDERAERVLLAVQELAIVVRDEGGHAVREAAQKAIRAAGDAAAALVIAAACIRVDEPVELWWQNGPQPAARTLRPCGTASAYSRHLNRGETPCQPCRTAHAQARATRKRQQRAIPA